MCDRFLKVIIVNQACPYHICYSLPGRKKTVSFSQERKASDSEMSTDTDGRTPDTDVTDSVSDTEEEEKSGSARRRWKIGIGKVGTADRKSEFG